jgi:hypothetical protein
MRSKIHAKLSDQVEVLFVGIVQLLDEFFRARVGDGAEVFTSSSPVMPRPVSATETVCSLSVDFNGDFQRQDVRPATSLFNTDS